MFEIWEEGEGDREESALSACWTCAQECVECFGLFTWHFVYILSALLETRTTTTTLLNSLRAERRARLARKGSLCGCKKNATERERERLACVTQTDSIDAEQFKADQLMALTNGEWAAAFHPLAHTEWERERALCLRSSMRLSLSVCCWCYIASAGEMSGRSRAPKIIINTTIRFQR